MPERADVRALRADYVSEHGLPGCAGVGCPRCRGLTSPELVATCRSGRCAVVDLRRSPISRCSADDECVLAFARCCACGAPRESVVAIRAGAEADLMRLACGDEAVACPDCVGFLPDDLSAFCDHGHCATR